MAATRASRSVWPTPIATTKNGGHESPSNGSHTTRNGAPAHSTSLTPSATRSSSWAPCGRERASSLEARHLSQLRRQLRRSVPVLRTVSWRPDRDDDAARGSSEPRLAGGIREEDPRSEEH